MEKQIEIPMLIPKARNLPRPGWEQLKEKYWKAITENIFENWCESTDDKFDLYTTVCEVFTYEGDLNRDGFDLAKKFDNKGYSANAALVDVLDNISFCTDNIKTKGIAQWVDASEMEPLLKEGQEVKMPAHYKEGPFFICLITEVDRTYGVGKSIDAKMCWFFEWEKLEALNVETKDK